MGDNIIKLFWKHINNADFEKLNKLMIDDACVWLPNTREVFRGKDKYIEFNKRYPDRWYVDLEKVYVCGENLISVATIFNEQKTTSCYVTSIFKVKDNLIEEMTEYYGENGEPPKWRMNQNLSERY